ncbi:response regulator transcription factor [Roseibacillus ishigakijimensis]|uniref:Response regulator transcription factor n=1 Tax=Roseibacillus ishigakijimensis TaxID=454146 RepID=A0A934RRT0_9BACT|nr:response regulator transcription factor [Roseibacillus ishigakijimensis]MBK1834461.1 response regulator transcription factor [Roseibacillus ishigakijimensis]
MTILLADDDPLTLEALSACMESEGFRTLQAADGRQALQRWREEKPDLACLDIMMPGLSGYEVCRRIRQSDRELPILFLSAKNQEIDIVAGLDLGADDFVRKPFTRREVMARIRAILRRSRPDSARESYLLGDLEVQPKALLARRGEQIIELTAREVSILTLLHQHRGEAVTRDALLDTCWGQDYFPDSRTLDQHIHQLRKKIEPDSAHPTLIETVRAVGYRLR